MNEKEKINSDVKYQPEGVSGFWLGAIAVLIVIAAILLHFLVWGLYGSFKENGISVPEAESLKQYNVPPEPNLKPDPIGNYEEFRRTENEKLNDYGWVDKEKGIVHIPVEQAMKKLAQNGLPAIEPTNQTATANVNANAAQNNLPLTTNTNVANKQGGKTQ